MGRTVGGVATSTPTPGSRLLSPPTDALDHVASSDSACLKRLRIRWPGSDAAMGGPNPLRKSRPLPDHGRRTGSRETPTAVAFLGTWRRRFSDPRQPHWRIAASPARGSSATSSYRIRRSADHAEVQLYGGHLVARRPGCPSRAQGPAPRIRITRSPPCLRLRTRAVRDGPRRRQVPSRGTSRVASRRITSARSGLDRSAQGN